MKKIFALALALLLPLSTLTPGALAVEHAAPPVQPEENPLPDVWTEVSTAEELFAAGGSAPLVRLTEDLTVTAADAQFFPFWTVSYTHLTLPTILPVLISVVGVSLKKKKHHNHAHIS